MLIIRLCFALVESDWVFSLGLFSLIKSSSSIKQSSFPRHFLWMHGKVVTSIFIRLIVYVAQVTVCQSPNVDVRHRKGVFVWWTRTCSWFCDSVNLGMLKFIRWRIHGRGPGGLPPLIFRQNWGLKGRKNFLEAAPPFSKGVNDCHPPLVSQGLDPALLN